MMRGPKQAAGHVSALLTAGYLLPVTLQGFLPGTDYDYGKLKNKEPAKKNDCTDYHSGIGSADYRIVPRQVSAVS